MVATKFLPLALVFVPVAAAVIYDQLHTGHRVLSVHIDDAADDVEKCISMAAQFIKPNVTREQAVEQAVDFCASDARIKENNYVCPHFKEGIERALEKEPNEKQYDAAEFCKLTEAYMLNIRGASRVPRTGSGPLLDFKISPECEPAVASAFAPQDSLESASVPDFWYAMCMNQDCAHFLPSRTKWCNIQRSPTHSYIVCEAVRKFALDEVQVHDEKKMTPGQLCTLYGEFAKEMGIDVDAYEHVIHFDSPKRIPVPSDKERALISSQLLNSAKAHHLRDNAASPVEQKQN